MNNELETANTTKVIRTEDGSLDVEAYKNIVGIISLDGLDVAVTIVSARLAYGRLDFSITPKFGEGSKWVSSSRVRFTNSLPSPSGAKGKSRDVVSAPSFREEVARRRALHLKNDAERKFLEIKSSLDTLITNKKEESNENESNE